MMKPPTHCPTLSVSPAAPIANSVAKTGSVHRIRPTRVELDSRAERSWAKKANDVPSTPSTR